MTAPAGRALRGVVVAYGAPELLAAALGGLQGRYEVTVVDNSSDAEVAAAARRAGARYLDPGANLGYAAGVNVGLGAGPEGSDVLLLNPDATISPPALERLHEALLAEPSLACVAPAQRAPGAARPAPVRWRWHTPLSSWAEAAGVAPRPGRGFLSGAVLLLRAEALADLGGFDERYFLYAEEEDWQRRARRRGWTLAVVPDAVAEHAAGGTQRDMDVLRLRLHSSTERYLRKWYRTPGWQLHRAGVVAGQLVRALVRGGEPRRAAVALARLYLREPDRAARERGVVPAPPAEALTPGRSWARGRRRGRGTGP